jgi:hypothetical protein
MRSGTDMYQNSSGRKEDPSSPTMRRDPQGRLILHIPMSFKKRVGRKEIVLPPGCGAEDEPETDSSPCINHPLALAMALGHRWMDLLRRGRFRSVAALSDVVGMDPSQIRRHLSLACLSPRLVRTILDGNEPNGMSLEKLKEIPVRWEEQG